MNVLVQKCPRQVLLNEWLLELIIRVHSYSLEFSFLKQKVVLDTFVTKRHANFLDQCYQLKFNVMNATFAAMTLKDNNFNAY